MFAETLRVSMNLSSNSGKFDVSAVKKKRTLEDLV